MKMSFSFNFLPPDDTKMEEIHQPNTNAPSAPTGGTTTTESNFHWLQQNDVKTALQEISRNYDQVQRASQILSLSQNATDTSSLASLRQVQEDVVSAESTSQYNKTDLVPGIYEGGLKVWECCMDLCKYLHDHDITLQGHVLELGCGHGLPSCWVLKKALSDQSSVVNCWVTFSDYNEFALKDVTLKNVLLNAKDTCPSSLLPGLPEWLSKHTAFGAGDWKRMSNLLLQPAQDSSERPLATPKDGFFDFILAAETTYSETAAVQTAELLARHLRPGKGVAYVATKRYYFGVRGGSSFLVDVLNQQTSHSFDIQVLEEYDNGVGNIRELLLIRGRPS